MKQTLYFLCILLLVCLGGCHDRKLPEEKPAAELNAEGQKKFDDRDYRSSISSFQKVRDWYPFSDLVITAEIRIADAQYKLRQYDEAATAYEEFADLHPRNDLTPYALYQAGRCFFDQKSSIDRDLTNAEKALDRLTRFVERYPDNPYADAARAHITDCQRAIAAHELLIAQYYFDRKHYAAALKRFKTILTDYPDVGVQHAALQYIVSCEDQINREKASAPSENAADAK